MCLRKSCNKVMDKDTNVQGKPEMLISEKLAGLHMEYFRFVTLTYYNQLGLLHNVVQLYFNRT